MKKISDFNNATEKYPVIYAGSATRPEFVDMPTTLQQQEGVAPMDTLPAQWWNAMWKLATKDINAFRDYVGDSITEINNLLTKFGITLDDADSEQLYDFFHNDYVQNYLNGIYVNKSGDTIDGDLHIKGNLSVDGIGEEIISTELKVGANTITLRNGNPSALGNTELAGVVTENYDGNNHNNIISIDKNGIARTGDIDIATRILYSNNGTNFFTDEGLTIPATIGETEEVRDTGNQTSSGVKIYEGVTYSNNDTQALATREDNPKDGAFMKWDATTKKLVSGLAIPDPSLNGTVLTASVGQNNKVTVGWQPLIQPVDSVTSGDMRPVTSNAVNNALANYSTKSDVNTIKSDVNAINHRLNIYALYDIPNPSTDVFEIWDVKLEILSNIYARFCGMIKAKNTLGDHNNLYELFNTTAYNIKPKANTINVLNCYIPVTNVISNPFFFVLEPTGLCKGCASPGYTAYINHVFSFDFIS